MFEEENKMKNAQKAYNDGCYSGHKGQPVTDNPFDPVTEQFGYKEWLLGWNAGQTIGRDVARYGAD
jgi:hypothetical protein